MTGARARQARLLLALALAACGNGKTASRPGRDGGDAGPSRAVTSDGDAGGASSAVVAAPGGTIAVTVQWPDAPAAMRASPGVTACATQRPPRATIGALHGVAGVVVTIEDGVAGPPPPVADPVRLTVRACALAPRVAVVPGLGATLELQSQDDGDHALTITEIGLPWATGAGDQPAITTRARLSGWGHTVALPLPTVGARMVVADGAEDAAYVVVTAGPYAVVTAADGTAALAQVPAGTYTVLAWLPPAGDQAPMIVRGQATVVAGDRVELTLRLGS